jgi:hypothetical protein
LALRLTRADHPLTARVLVNRIWGKLMGRPLVETPSNFGSLGSRPSHPELLDDLAVRFVRRGWSIKWLCREIVTSATYQQTSGRSGYGDTIDQQNRSLWRMHRKRLTVEQWRDAVLSATGEMQRDIGGPNITPDDPQAKRRTVYCQASRLKLHPMLALFDYPDPNAHSSMRSETTTPSQKLFMMNSPWILSQARLAAGRVASQADGEDPIRCLYRLLFTRDPSDDERRFAEQYLTDSGAEFRNNSSSVAASARFHSLVHALLISNEMIFLD